VDYSGLEFATTVRLTPRLRLGTKWRHALTFGCNRNRHIDDKEEDRKPYDVMSWVEQKKTLSQHLSGFVYE
jgi:hypothetical protein